VNPRQHKDYRRREGPSASSTSPRASVSRPPALIPPSKPPSADRRRRRTHSASRRPDSVGTTTISRRLTTARSRDTSPAACIRSHNLLAADADAPINPASRLKFKLPARSITSNARN